jgi:hypothetical protein
MNDPDWMRIEIVVPAREGNYLLVKLGEDTFRGAATVAPNMLRHDMGAAMAWYPIRNPNPDDDE